MAKSKKTTQLIDWYHREKPVLESLARTAESILQNLISKASIPVVSIASRVKTSESLLDKQKRKRYKKPLDEITDFVGLRVITYTEDDTTKVCEIVRAAFDVDEAQSLNKATQLDVDQIGYRSHHYVCALGARRVALPEFETFKGRVFEVQIRTVLQHAWAEVEHDRNYKFSGVLPSELRRRLYLISGLLETGDRELNNLSRDIDAYTEAVASQAKSGKLEDELNSTTLPAIVAQIAKKLPDVDVEHESDDDLRLLIEECIAFKLKTTSDVNDLFTNEFLNAVNESEDWTNTYALVRDAMMWADLERYFSDAWQHHWQADSPEPSKVLIKKYPPEKVEEVFNSSGAYTQDDDMPEYGEW